MNRKNRWIVIGMNVLALLMLASVITGHLFHLPVYDGTGEVTMIVMACSLTSLSTFFYVDNNKKSPQ